MVRLKFVDRLRYIETMVSDNVRGLYLQSQRSLTRAQLDARNSINNVTGFHEKMVEVYNNRLWQPTSRKLEELHPDFAEEIDLFLGDYRLTFERSKQILADVKPALKEMINN